MARKNNKKVARLPEPIDPLEKIEFSAQLLGKASGTLPRAGADVLKAMAFVESRAIALTRSFVASSYLTPRQLIALLKTKGIRAENIPLLAAFFFGYLSGRESQSAFCQETFGGYVMLEDEGDEPIVKSVLVALLKTCRP